VLKTFKVEFHKGENMNKRRALVFYLYKGTGFLGWPFFKNKRKMDQTLFKPRFFVEAFLASK